MNKTIAVLAITFLLVPILGQGSLSEFIAYGSPYGPSFGGGSYHYTDGLVINGKTFDISGYSQKIPAQNLTIGIPSNVTLKIFDNAGSYAIRTATISLQTHGIYSSVPSNVTTIQYNLSGKTTIQDPDHYIASAKGTAVYSGKFVYVTFTITPHSRMNPSNMIVSSTDNKLATGYSFVMDAISFRSDPTYLHASPYQPQCTASYPCIPLCGNHPCKPGSAVPNSLNLPISTIIVNAYDSSGMPISGIYVQVNQTSQTIHSGYTSFSFVGFEKVKYLITPEKYDSACDFNHWKDNGSTTRTRTLISNSTTTIIAAVYSGICP